jgi:predicted permease
MEYLASIIEKVLYVILLMSTGILAKKLKWLSSEGEKDLSRLMIDFVWPALIFSSIVTTLSAEDIRLNFLLPLLACLIHLTGYGIGFIACRLAGYSGGERRMFLLHAAMNNFFVMALPFAEFFFPQRGAALLAVANLGSIVLLWTLGVFTLAGNPGLKATVRNIFSPGMVATIAAVFCVLTGVNRYIPRFVSDALVTAGQPTMFLGLVIAGTQIYRLGRNALKFNSWNILVGLIRNILTPGILFLLALLFKGYVDKEALVIFLVVSITPASVNSVTLALKYNSLPDLAAEGVIFTHIFAVATMPVFVILIEKFFAA